MRLTRQSCLMMALSVLLICISAAPVHPNDTGDKRSTGSPQSVSRQPFTLFGIDIKPRLPLRLGGGGGLYKSKPKPAPVPITNDKPNPPPPAPPKPIPAASVVSKPAPAASAVSKPAPSKPVPTTQRTTSQSTKTSAITSQSSLSIASSGTISASSRSTGSVSATKSSSSRSSSTSSGEQVQTTRDPRDALKCTKNGCFGTTCRNKAPKGKGGKGKTSKGTTPKSKTPKGKGARGIGNGVDLALREFRPVDNNGDLVDFPTNPYNENLSGADHTESPFMRFDARNRLSIRVKGLQGCTVVAAVSARGMIATHLFENGDQPIDGNEDNVRPDIENTLHPDAYRATLARAKTLLSAHKADLAGGKLVIMMPINSDGGPKQGKFRYDTETWPAVSRRNPDKFLKSRVKGTGISKAIVKMAEDATGLRADVAKYEVASENETPEPSLSATIRAFVMQYDPKNAPKTAEAAGAQIYIGGKEHFEPVFHFATPGSAAAAASAPAPAAAGPAAAAGQ